MTNKFDIDLSWGQIFEKKLEEILRNKKVEVKTERDVWKVSGNIAIEYEYKGKKSGIAVTEAEWWAHILSDNGEIKCIMMMPTEELKKIARKHLDKKTVGGDNDDSKMVLVPINELMRGEQSGSQHGN
tara:strand:+ start:39 stop:422 length:384 start_codon:yes stop_codon:yes gene_type:complete